MDNFQVGQRVQWRCTPHGMWGARFNVPATVVGHTKARIKIEVETRSGNKLVRFVAPGTLVMESTESH